MKRLMKKSLLTMPPEIGNKSKLQDDEKYEWRQAPGGAGVRQQNIRDSAVVIWEDEIYYGGWHMQVLKDAMLQKGYTEDEIQSYGSSSAMNDQFIFGYYLQDYLGKPSMFFESYIDQSKYTSIVQGVDPNIAIYTISNEELERVAKLAKLINRNKKR